MKNKVEAISEKMIALENIIQEKDKQIGELSSQI